MGKLTKVQEAELADLKDRLRKARAFSFTYPVKPDVELPKDSGAYAVGWTYHYNDGNFRLQRAAASEFSHRKWEAYDKDPVNLGERGYSWSRSSVSLFSSAVLALRAARYEMELDFSAKLAKIDAAIEAEAAKGQP